MASQGKNSYFPTLKNVYMYWKIIGLCPFVLVEDGIGHRSCGAIFYVSILTVAYTIIYHRAVMNRMSVIMSQETPMTVLADFFGLTLDFLVTVTAWIHVTLRHHDLQKIVKMFKKVQEISKTIDIRQDFSRFFGVVKLHTILMNITWITLSIADHLLLYDYEKLDLFIWLPFNAPRIIGHNIFVMFIDVLLMTKIFFSSLNKKILNLSGEVSVKLVTCEDNRNLFKSDRHQRFVLEVCGQMHSDLVSLTEMIIDFFSSTITLILLKHSVLMASDLYSLGLITLEPNFLSWTKLLLFVDTSCWWFMHFIEIVILIAVSDSTTNKANRTGSALHSMLTMDTNEKYYDSGRVLSLRLLQRQLTIELYGLFELRLSIVHKIVGMVITYVTIMMQIDIQDLQQRQM